MDGGEGPLALMLCFVRRPSTHFVHNIKHDLILTDFLLPVLLRGPQWIVIVRACARVAYRNVTQRCDEIQYFLLEKRDFQLGKCCQR